MKAAISLFEDVEPYTITNEDGTTRQGERRKLLCTYSKKYGAWMLPGSDGLDGIQALELPEVAQARILLFQTNLRTTNRQEVYNGPQGIIWAITVEGTSKNSALFSREEFLRFSPFKVFYEKLFAHMDNTENNDSRVVLRAKSGRILYAYVTESWYQNSKGMWGWWIDAAKFIHAASPDEALKQVETSGILTVSCRIHKTNGVPNVAPAVGYKLEKETSKGRLLIA